MNIFDDFEKTGDVSDELISSYTDKLPYELMSVWQEYGFGTFYGGYLKVINPDEYKDILDRSYFRGDVAVPVLATAFGDIITWEKNRFVGIVRYRYGTSEIMISNFKLFLTLLNDKSFVNKFFTLSTYDESVSTYGNLAYDECFGYVPLLGLGGKETVENLKIVKLREHIELIAEMTGEI